MKSVQLSKVKIKSVMAVRDFKKFFKRRGRFVRQLRNDKGTFQRSRDDKNGKGERKCFRCGDPNHLIGECLKPPRDKNERAFIRGSWSNSGEEDDEKVNNEACLVAQEPNKIQMAESDEEKTAFHTSQGVYYYTKMPFGLKNAGATYQRLVDKAFDSQVGQNMEVYVDDLVIKSHTEAEMLRDIDETFRTFLSKSAKKSLPLFKTLKRCIKKSDFHWTPEAEQAFKQLKHHFSELPLLVAPKPKEELIVYLSASYGAVSAVLMTERGTVQTPVYFISRALQGPELNYTPMEKLVLSLVFAAKRLRRYFQAHPIAVITDQPIKQIMSRPDVAGRLQKWSVMLGEHITYRPRTSVKGQILADFLVEKPDENPPNTPVVATPPEPWTLFRDGSSCVDGSAEYEALIAGLRIAAQMGVQNVQVNVNSKLVANQVLGTYVAKEDNMIKYLEKVKGLILMGFRPMYSGRGSRSRAQCFLDSYAAAIIRSGGTFGLSTNSLVGNGESTKFWDDIWIGSKPLKLLFSRIYALDNIKDATICMKLNEPSLDNNFRRSIRGGIEQSQFKELTDLLIPIVLNPCPDRWFWSLEGSGEFSVASIRRFIDDQRLLTVDSKTLWIKSVPIKVNILAWKIKLEALPTRFNISRRGIEIDSILCPICDRGVESTRHIFFSCCLVRQIARKICSWWDIEYSDVNSFTEWINWMASLRLQSKVKMMIQGVFFVVWWLVWSYRNKLLFEEKKPSKAIIFDDVVSISFYWCKSRCKASFSWDDWLKNPSLISL
ncbi:reverse transcriptase domain-containing protein [Tanacetum coccineum]